MRRTSRNLSRGGGEVGVEGPEIVCLALALWPQAACVTDRTAFFTVASGLVDWLVENDRTDKICSRPANQKTLDYVTGRFG